MADYVRAAGSEVLGPNDVTRAAGAETVASGDAAVDKGPCDCCGSTEGCPVLPCGPVPQSADFAFAGLAVLDSSAGGTDDPACCYIQFGGGAFRVLGIVECLSRRWTVAYASTTSFLATDPGTGHTARACIDHYVYQCQIGIADPNVIDGNGLYLRVVIDLTVRSARDLTTGLLIPYAVFDPIAPFPSVELNFGWGYGHNFFGEPSDGCGAHARYTHTYADGDIPCAGPWTLELDTFNSEAAPLAGWPATVAVTPSPDSAPVFVTDCCPGLVADYCLHPPPAETYYCDTETGTCVDPGDATGSFTGPSALVNCLENCTGGTPIGDSGTGGGGGVTDLDCCPGQTLPLTISLAVANLHDCPCLDDIITNLVWSNGFRAWTASLIACGGFVTFYFYCLAGQYGFRVVCNGVTIVDELHEPGLPCFPISEHFVGTITIPNSCCVNLGAQLEFSITGGGGGG